MPTLRWIGKGIIEKRHNEVPYHPFQYNENLSLGGPEGENLLNEGDSLLAPKAVPPYYARQTKCTCIDPLFNKRADRWSNDDSEEERAIDELWVEKGGDNCLFIMLKGTDWDAIKKNVQ